MKVVAIFLYLTLHTAVSARSLLEISETSLYESKDRVYFTYCDTDVYDGVLFSAPLDTCVSSLTSSRYSYWTQDGGTYSESVYFELNGVTCSTSTLQQTQTWTTVDSCQNYKQIMGSSKSAFYSYATADLWLASSATASCDSSTSEDLGMVYGVSYGDCISISDGNGDSFYYTFNQAVDGVKWTTYSDSSCSSSITSSTRSIGSCSDCPPGETSCSHIFRGVVLFEGSADGVALGIAITVISTTAIAGAAVSSAVSSGIAAGAGGGGGGSGSPGALGAIMALLSSMQTLGMYSSLPFQTTPNLSGMTANTAWTNLHIAPPFALPDCDNCQSSVVQNLSNPDLLNPQTQWIGNLFWWMIVFILLLVIHLIILCCWYTWVRCIRRNKEKSLPGFMALPKWEMMFMLISYQGLCLSTGAAAFTASPDYTIAAVIVMVILLSFPCVIAGIIFFGSRKNVTYSKHRFCLIEVFDWFSVLRTSCKEKSWKGLVSDEMIAASKGVFFNGKWSGNEEWQNKWDFLMLDLTTISRYWRVFELLWIFARSLMITCIIGFTGAPYLQACIILMVFVGCLLYRLIVGTHLQRYANIMGIITDALNILALFMTMLTYTNDGTGLSDYNLVVIDALLTTALAAVIFARIIPVVLIPLVGLIMLVKPVVDIIFKSSKRSRNQTLQRVGSKMGHKFSSDNIEQSEIAGGDNAVDDSGVTQLENGQGMVPRKAPNMSSLKSMFICGRGMASADESDLKNDD